MLKKKIQNTITLSPHMIGKGFKDHWKGLFEDLSNDTKYMHVGQTDGFFLNPKSINNLSGYKIQLQYK